MKKIKEVIYRILGITYLKYAAVTLAGIAIVGFAGDSSVWAHLRNKRQITQLQEEIKYHTDRHKHDQAQIRLLNTTPKAMERIARERYYMKEDDEDIFILSDDDRTPELVAPENNETAQ